MRINLLKTYPPEAAAFRKLLHAQIDRVIERAVDELRESPNIQPRTEDLQKMRERILRESQPFYEELARVERFAETSIIIVGDEEPASRVFLVQPDGLKTTYLEVGTFVGLSPPKPVIK